MDGQRSMVMRDLCVSYVFFPQGCEAFVYDLSREGGRFFETQCIWYIFAYDLVVFLLKCCMFLCSQWCRGSASQIKSLYAEAGTISCPLIRR